MTYSHFKCSQSPDMFPINLTLFLSMFQMIFFSIILSHIVSAKLFSSFSMLMCLLYFVLNSTIFNLISRILYSTKKLVFFLATHLFMKVDCFVCHIEISQNHVCPSLYSWYRQKALDESLGVHGGDLLVFRPMVQKIIEY